MLSKRLDFDPATSAGPFESAFQDVADFAVLLWLASLLQRFLHGQLPRVSHPEPPCAHWHQKWGKWDHEQLPHHAQIIAERALRGVRLPDNGSLLTTE